MSSSASRVSGPTGYDEAGEFAHDYNCFTTVLVAQLNLLATLRKMH